jgi:competence protein ComEA
MKNVLNVVAGVLTGLLLAAIFFLISRPPRGDPVELVPPPTPIPITVYVAGAVSTPGVYALPEYSRVEDALKAAGGLLSNADRTNLNLAALLEDGEQLVIPTQLPTLRIGTPPAGPTEVAPMVIGQLVNINTADQATLESLPGVGPTLAQKIIDYRTQNGLFQQIEDIDDVTGVGPATYAKIKDLITVGQ